MNIERKLKRQVNVFRKYETKLKDNPTKENASLLMRLGMSKSIPVYYSEMLEKYFMDLAEKTKKLPKNYESIKGKKKTYLHVMTKAYLTGGHTRVVERWIDSANESEKHSLVMLEQDRKSDFPNLLAKVVESKNGELIFLNNKDSIENRANELRNIAFNYEVIILHHHSDDPIPLMAFSVKEFNRSVICFNHAGHFFWVGRNIVDFCVDIEKGQNFITKQKRGIKNTRIVNMPVDKYYPVKKDIEEKRKELGFKPEDKIIISMASNWKFNDMKGLKFKKTLGKILEKDKSIVFIAVGADRDSKKWRALSNKFKGRINLLGDIPHGDIKNYLQVADLYLDSFYNSWLSFTDAINIAQLPSLLLKTSIGYLPYLEGTESICHSIDELIEKSLFYLNNKKEAIIFANKLSSLLQDHCSLDTFSKEVREIVEYTKKINKDDKRFTKPKETFVPSDFYHYLLKDKNVNTHIKVKVPFVLRYEKIKNRGTKSLKIKIPFIFQYKKIKSRGAKSLKIKILRVRVFKRVKTNRRKIVKVLCFPLKVQFTSQ